MTREEAQIALVTRLREVRRSLPPYVTEETILTVQSTDRECIRLKRLADNLWSQP